MNFLSSLETLLGKKKQPQQIQQAAMGAAQGAVQQAPLAVSQAQPGNISSFSQPRYDGANAQATIDPFGSEDPMRGRYPNVNPTDTDRLAYLQQLQRQRMFTNPFDNPASQSLGISPLQRTNSTDSYFRGY